MSSSLTNFRAWHFAARFKHIKQNNRNVLLKFEWKNKQTSLEKEFSQRHKAFCADSIKDFMSLAMAKHNAFTASSSVIDDGF